jgi:hypothetical protein
MGHSEATSKEVALAAHRESSGVIPDEIFEVEENLNHPLGPYFYLWSVTYCMTVSLAQGGEGLGTVWGEQKTLGYLADAGFQEVIVRKPEGDYINSFYISTKQ